MKMLLCMLCTFNMLTATNVFAQDPPQGEEKIKFGDMILQ